MSEMGLSELKPQDGSSSAKFQRRPSCYHNGSKQRGGLLVPGFVNNGIVGDIIKNEISVSTGRHEDITRQQIMPNLRHGQGFQLNTKDEGRTHGLLGKR